MSVFPFDLADVNPTRLGVIVLQSDETIERDMMQMRRHADIFFSRVPSGQQVTSETLQSMAGHITASAALFPETLTLDAVGYGCTSGTAQIRVREVSRLTKNGCKTQAVTEPVSALVAACTHLGLKKLAFLSPYIESVSTNLRRVLQDNGITTPTFGTFAEGEEAKVVRIAKPSIMSAAQQLVKDADVDGIFLSCTNLRTLDVIDDLEATTHLPVLSSNLVLAWHLAQLSENAQAMSGPGRLFGDPA